MNALSSGSTWVNMEVKGCECSQNLSLILGNAQHLKWRGAGGRGYLVRFQPPWLFFPCILWPTEDMQIGMQSHLFTGVNLLFQRFLLGWVLGITGSLMLNKGCPCRSRCRWRLYGVLVFVCTPRAPPPAAGCSHGNPHAWHKRGPEKVLELSLHSGMQGQPLAFLPMASSIILCCQCAFAKDTGEHSHLMQSESIWK